MKIEKILYFGTAPIAVPALEALHAQPDCEVVAVCTQPDRPSGRKRKLTPSAVKVCAEKLGLPVLTPEKIGELREELALLDADLSVVFAYGQYIPKSVFDQPVRGSINFHPSLLPKYRGASPIQSSLLDGVTESGLSVLQVSEKMDAGDLLMQAPLNISPEDNSISLHERYAALAAELVPQILAGLRDETLLPVPQKESEATECGKISKEDGLICWEDSATMILNRLRAFQPWPGAFFPLGDKGNLKVLHAVVEPGEGRPGELLDVKGEGPLIACGHDAIRLLRVQPPGKKPMDGKSFLNGNPTETGTVFSGS
ncbi:methionyl-tRNA formyltransferase [Kiritimatiellaeota bacterium B1221]|nr:methionyl-tRNA formyltransferase [Kiritimatiellaeota bacterium B1221]